MGKKEAEAEDLVIQETLSMSEKERLELLANLIVDKIAEDQQRGRSLLSRAMELQNNA